MLISKGGIGGLEGLEVGDFFSAFSGRGRSVLIAKRGLDGLEGLDIDSLP
jgi:hypothetical protein